MDENLEGLGPRAAFLDEVDEDLGYLDVAQVLGPGMKKGDFDRKPKEEPRVGEASATRILERPGASQNVRVQRVEVGRKDLKDVAANRTECRRELDPAAFPFKLSSPEDVLPLEEPDLRSLALQCEDILAQEAERPHRDLDLAQLAANLHDERTRQLDRRRLADESEEDVTHKGEDRVD